MVHCWKQGASAQSGVGDFSPPTSPEMAGVLNPADRSLMAGTLFHPA